MDTPSSSSPELADAIERVARRYALGLRSSLLDVPKASNRGYMIATVAA
jgi:hypothetical protein